VNVKRNWTKIILLVLIVMIPVAVAAVTIVSVARNGIDPRPSRPLSWLAYDTTDASAYGIRVWNSDVGRKAGDLSEPNWVNPDEYSIRLQQSDTLRPRYFAEYPPLAIFLFRGIWPSPPPVTPMAGLLDGSYINVSRHTPRDSAQKEIWHWFAVGFQRHVMVMLAVYIIFLIVLYFGYEPSIGGIRPVALAVLPGICYFSLSRFDIVPATMIAISLLLLARRRIVSSAVILGIAGLIKVFPLVLIPFVICYLFRQNRRCAFLWIGIVSSTFALGILTPLALGSDWPSTINFLRFQMNRPPTTEHTIYGRLIPVDFGAGTNGTAFRLIVLSMATLVLCIKPIRSLSGLMSRAAILMILLANLATFYSPQWVLWFAPLVLPLSRKSFRLTILVVISDLANYFCYPVWWKADHGTFPIYTLVSSVDWPSIQINVRELLTWLRMIATSALALELIRIAYKPVTTVQQEIQA